MPWRSLVVEVDAVAAEPLSEALLAHGAAAASLEDAAAGTDAEQPVFDEPGAARSGWPRARLRALVPAAVDPETLLRRAAAAAGLLPPAAFAVEPVADDDWVRRTQAEFAPIRISGRLWIVPSWHRPPDPDAIHLVLDPGRAFGTGSHPTTRACLRWLERRVVPGARVLDYGCGSGILAVAALKLGAGEAVGVDIDPEALAAARENAAVNRVPAQFRDAGAPLELTADLVVANILANPLVVLAPLLARHCRRGGRIALAGLLEAQGPRVADAYGPWFEIAAFDRDEGWIVLEGTRR
jgi:ribosomal protein L11 methyltransferase